MAKKSSAVQHSAPAFNIEKTIQGRAEKALARLLKRGGDARDFSQARKFAAAAKSWCSMNPEIGATSASAGRSSAPHSRRRGGATWRMWDMVISMCATEIAG